MQTDQKKWMDIILKTDDAMEYFMDEIENPKVNNTDERWECATTIETWYSELELR